MIVFEKARELGELIRTTEESVNKSDALEAYLNDKEALEKMKEYETYQTEIQIKLENGELDKGEFGKASEKLKEMGTELKKHPVVGPYIESVNKYNFMINQVFGIIQKTASGDEDCAGNCESGCSSGCSHGQHSH